MLTKERPSLWFDWRLLWFDWLTNRWLVSLSNQSKYTNRQLLPAVPSTGSTGSPADGW
jgi:hypothetical protein